MLWQRGLTQRGVVGAGSGQAALAGVGVVTGAQQEHPLAGDWRWEVVGRRRRGGGEEVNSKQRW
jgi:hypothetical protein